MKRHNVCYSIQSYQLIYLKKIKNSEVQKFKIGAEIVYNFAYVTGLPIQSELTHLYCRYALL
jgi:hypothetical protein